jgi:hypothetical protein
MIHALVAIVHYPLSESEPDKTEAGLIVPPPSIRSAGLAAQCGDGLFFGFVDVGVL